MRIGTGPTAPRGYPANGAVSPRYSGAVNVGDVRAMRDVKSRLDPRAGRARPHAIGVYIFTVTVLTSVYCWRPYSPSSRPMPDCLKPPKGAAASKTS